MEFFRSESNDERVDELVARRGTRETSISVFCNICLVIAGVFIVGSVIITLLNMNDRIIFGVLVPGVMVGLFFVGLYVWGGRHAKDRQELSTFIRKKRRPI